MAAPPLSILFDLDGTVVDSKPGILASCNAALRSLGHRPDSLDIGNLIGPPLEEVLAEVLGRFGDDRVAEAVLAYRGHYGSVGFRETTVYPGLAAALDQLLALKAKLYIATSKRTIFAEQILEHLGLIDLFTGVHGSEPGGAVDRKADLIADVLRRHELSVDRCLMVGDRDVVTPVTPDHDMAEHLTLLSRFICARRLSSTSRARFTGWDQYEGAMIGKRGKISRLPISTAPGQPLVPFGDFWPNSTHRHRP